MSNKNQKEQHKFTVLKQSWTESERGWGQRPDGYTLHLTREERDKYVKGYNAKWNNEPQAPDVYSFADGEPTTISVDKQTYDKLLNILQLPKNDDPLMDYVRYGMWG